MKPTIFAEHNQVFKAPADWDESVYGPCADLYVYQNGGMITSVWKPSAEELAVLNAGGGVALTVHSNAQPVVSMWTIVLEQIDGVAAAAPTTQPEEAEDVEEVISEVVEPHPEVVNLANGAAALSSEEENDTIEDLISKGQSRH